MSAQKQVLQRNEMKYEANEVVRDPLCQASGSEGETAQCSTL